MGGGGVWFPLPMSVDFDYDCEPTPEDYALESVLTRSVNKKYPLIHCYISTHTKYQG
jgi:hypothetical protein